jgi:hypothetical protein
MNTDLSKAHEEILQMIRENLAWGDIKTVAAELNVSATSVSLVLSNKAKSKRVFHALLKKAEQNKREMKRTAARFKN